MAETLSPNPAGGQKQRLPMSALIQSPTSPFLLGSNDDQLERAQSRAARAAAIRRKAVAAKIQLQSFDEDSDPCLNKQQILDLLQNCIKLASENKINQKNTWELNLIDHLTDIIKVEEENDVETNFQKASCTLEAGVKIYALRVDSVHSEAYKVLGGMNRAGQETEKDAPLENDSVEKEQEGSKKEVDRKLSPLSTLESSFEALNVKKFDAAFAVDPLYHQTSAQFDEGGAKGLLMNNLSVYGKCKVLFDSQEVPGKCVTSENQDDISDTIDISFAKECVEQMVLNMRMKDEISPTLRTIVNQFDENNRRPSDFQFSPQKAPEEFCEVNDCDVDIIREEYGNCTSWIDDHDDQTADDPCSNGANANFPSYAQANESFSPQDSAVEDTYEDVDGYLFVSLGFNSKVNAWAGPDHWKYRKAKGAEVNAESEDGPTLKPKLSRSKRQAEVDLDFANCLDKEMADIFCPPKNPKSLLLPENRPLCNTKLPEDCHYQPESLVKLFILPNVKCLGKRAKKHSGVFTEGADEQCNGYEFPSYEDGSICGDYGDVHSDPEESTTLVSQPRQVNKIEVEYDKTSKQVDVQVLKKTLWDHIQENDQVPLQDQKDVVSFREILANFPDDCKAAATITDISPHLCFICLLHLANENGLSIQSNPNLDDLSICLPRVGAA